MSDAPSNLFVYGTLKSPATFRAVCGWSFRPPVSGYEPPGATDVGAGVLAADEAILPDHDLISPDQLYFYAVPAPGRRVHGFLVRGVPPDALEQIARYEGPQYVRKTVTVNTKAGKAQATVFAATPGRLYSTRARGGGTDLKSEFAFRARIDKFFANKAARPYGDFGSEPTYVRAIKELKGATVHDLVAAHFITPGLSDFFIGQALAGPVRSFAPLRGDEDAALFADSYLSLLVRQVIFNQFESRIFEQFRHEVDRMRGGPRYYEHTVSSLAALRVLCRCDELLSTLAMDALNDLDYRRDDLADFVEWAILAADHIYDPAAAREAIEWVASNRVGGLLPLGAQLRLSNLPHGAWASGAQGQAGERAFDPAYDSFRYFEQFGLDLLCWKLGGRVQEMPEPDAPPGRRGRRGLLTFSLGATGRRPGSGPDSPAAGPQPAIGQPVTADLWMLSRLIEHIIEFYDIQPHALRVSIQVPRRLAPPPGRAGGLPESVVRCLLAIGGDGALDEHGRPQVRRLALREIVTLAPTRRLNLLEITHRPGRGGDEDLAATGVTTLTPDRRMPVARYLFPRLAPQVSYEPLVLALKGLQLLYRPGDMLTGKQMQADPELERLFNSVLEWGDRPTAIPAGQRDEFLDAVRAGLARERLGRSPHSPDYVERSVQQLADAIARFNELVSGGGATSSSPPSGR